MNFKFILWLLLMIINHALGEFLQMSLANVNTSMILMRISGITITACHMECAKQSLCHSIAITERSSNKLPDCLLLKEDNGFHGAGNEMTTIRTIGYGVKVNGQWGCWRSISACTVSCGGGSVNQSRDCDSPKPTHGGDNCTGPANRTVKCNEQNCPIHGQWGNWKNISVCDVSCGGGVLNESRDCDSPKPEHGGDECTGPSKRTVKCNEQVCPKYKYGLTKLSWDAAEADCVSWGGYLVKFETEGEMDVIIAGFKAYSVDDDDVWIGLNDKAVQSEYKWTDGTAPTFIPWGSGEPSSTTDNCVVLKLKKKTWWDRDCLDTYRYVCEK